MEGLDHTHNQQTESNTCNRSSSSAVTCCIAGVGLERGSYFGSCQEHKVIDTTLYDTIKFLPRQGK